MTAAELARATRLLRMEETKVDNYKYQNESVVAEWLRWRTADLLVVGSSPRWAAGATFNLRKSLEQVLLKIYMFRFT